MGALRVAIAAVAVAAAALAAVLLARGGPAPTIAPTVPVAVRTELGSAAVDFGSPVVTRIVVVLDRDAVRAGTLHVAGDLAPLTSLSAPSTTRVVAGRLETVTVEQRAACLTQECLAPTVSLPKAHVTVASRFGGTTSVSAPWRALRIRSRVSAKDLARATPRFAADTSPPAPSYRVSPSATSIVLEAIAGLAAAGAVALAALELLARRRRRVVETDELARALRLVRESERRPVPDRRRALGLLSNLAADDDVRDLAWSAREPDVPAIEDVLERHE